MSPLFISFEGIDGSGKTTLAKLLFTALGKRGIKALLTREPFDPDIRKKVLENDLTPWGEVFLFLGDRNLHVENLIKPRLREGYTVITDRFHMSTLAYQGFGRGLDLKGLKELNEKATGGLKPDMTFLVDVPVEVALERVQRERGNPDRFEDRAFLERVRQGFLTLAREEENVIVLDGQKSPYELLGEVIGRIDTYFRKKLI